MSRDQVRDPLAGLVLPASWLVPAIAAALWAGISALSRSEPLATLRSSTFALGPLLLLAGLHARSFPFLHAPERARALHLPLGAQRHFRAAARQHGPPLALSIALGVLALWSTGPRELGPRGLDLATGLAVEFAYLGVFAALLEPAAAGVAAALGRRFPEKSGAHEIQRSLGGGWTTPEAVIHLYAPAACVGAATLLAMPGQLGFERWFDGDPLTTAQLLWAIGPIGLAIAARVLAGRMYGLGFWQAVPWLLEATRTLAGPAQPEATPAWAAWIPRPHARLVLIELWRTTPLPALRLLAVLGLAVMTLMRDAPPSGPHLAIAAAVSAAWLVPAGSLARSRRARASLCGALPLPAGVRSGRIGAIGVTALVLPVVLLVLAVGGASVR